jgi:ribonuclease-3
MYLDAGLGPVRAFLERELEPVPADYEPARGDAKTRLQERLQARGEGTPQYRTTETRGPAHALEFSVEVRIGERVLGVGRGTSKRVAEQEAARRALEADPG